MKALKWIGVTSVLLLVIYIAFAAVHDIAAGEPEMAGEIATLVLIILAIGSIIGYWISRKRILA